MEKIKNLSIRKTIILYMTINLLASFCLSAAIIQIVNYTQQSVWNSYGGEKNYFELQVMAEIASDTFQPAGYTVSRTDAVIVEICDLLETWSILIIAVCGSVLAVFLFYRDKIRRPLEELKSGSRMIAENELEFTVSYTNKDEMGILCAEFEKMRGQLAENYKTMWKMIEQEKALRSAIAHDIRSPLAILKGCQEMLLEFIPSGSLDKDKIMDILMSGMGQIDHLNAFIDTMRQLSRLEDREMQYRRTELAEFIKMTENNAAILAEDSCAVCTIEADIQTRNTHACFDSFVVSEVLENLITNAIRYAVNEITIKVIVSDRKLMICVKDDGSGFQDGTDAVTKAYYHANPQDDLNHFGLGLYISRVYCEKHGGRLLTGNQIHGGAEVKAFFQLKDE